MPDVAVTDGRIIIDFDQGTVQVAGENATITHRLESAEGFEAVSRAWIRAGWDAKYVYSFTWMGRPIIQLPDDLLRLQEVVFATRPTAIIETGIAHGGSLVFYASLLRSMGIDGRVIGIDVEIRPHNRSAIEQHELMPMLALIEASSIEESTVARVRELLRPDDRVLVVLDSNHRRDHVARELELYAPLASVGSYVIVADGVMQELAGAPRSAPEWTWDNPLQAVEQYVRTHPEFAIETPSFRFNEGVVRSWPTYFPRGFMKRLR